MIIREKIARPPSSYDAHLYTFIDVDINKQYLGVHKGAVDDDYQHSSTNVEFITRLNDPETHFEFHVLKYGSFEDMLEIEHSILSESKIQGLLSKDFYNKSTGSRKYKGPNLNKITNLYNKIVAIDKEGNPENFEVIPEDLLTIHKDMERIQCRFKTIDKDNQEEITQRLIASNGDTSKCNPIVVFEGENTPEGDRRGNGTHTVTSCVASKMVDEIPVMRIPYENHKHLTEIERKRVCSLLNKPDEMVRKTTDWMDMAKDLKDNYLEYGIEPDSPHNKSFMDEVGLSTHFQERAIDKSMKDIAKDKLKGMNFIDWDASPHDAELSKDVDDYNDKPDYCAFQCSSASFKANRPLELFEKTNKKNCMIIMYHPTLKAEKAWNDREEQLKDGTWKTFEGGQTKWTRRFKECLKPKYKVHFIQKDMWESDGSK